MIKKLVVFCIFSTMLCVNAHAVLQDEVKVEGLDWLNLDKKITLPDVPKEYGRLVDIKDVNTTDLIDGSTLPVLILNLTFENEKGVVTWVKYEISREGPSHDPDFKLVLRNKWTYQFGRK